MTKAVETNSLLTLEAGLKQEPHLVNRLVPQVVRVLLRASTKYCSLLCIAALRGKVAAAKLLLEAKAHVNQQCEPGDRGVSAGDTPLAIAATGGSNEMVQLLLQQPGIDVDLPNDRRETPLLLASINKHTSIVRQLLAAKASVQRVDRHANTSLVLAARHRHLGAVHLLLQYGAPVNHRNKRGHTAFYYAVHREDESVATALLQANANVDQANNGGRSALMAAAGEGQLTMVRLCLAAGADVAREDSSRQTALHYAARGGDMAIVDELL